LILQRLVALVLIIVGGIGSQLALGAWLTAVPRLVESADLHGVGLEQFLNDVAVSIVKLAEEIGF